MVQKLKLYLNAIAPPILWALLIFSLSARESLPSFESNVYDFILKKTAHMFVYAVLYFLSFRGFQLILNKKHKAKNWILSFIVCLAYAITDELHQTIVPGRNGTLRDVGYDMLGASLVFLRKYGYI